FGCSLIYLLVLAPEVGHRVFASVVLALSAASLLACLTWRYAIGHEEEAARRELERLDREEADAARNRASEIARLRTELQNGFARAGSDAGARVLEGLSHEFNALQSSLSRTRHRSLMSFAHVLPSLAADTYLTGLGVLNQALGLLEVSEG